jgi:hypothetical protein
MYSIKPGRGPSAMGAMGGIIAVIFGLFWTVGAYQMTREAPFGFAAIFPLFGILFVVMGIVNVVYNLRNAGGRNRYSALDITTEKDEPDPINEAIRSRYGTKPPQSTSVEDRLAQLEALRNRGAITDQEFQEQRKRILGEI